MGLVMRMNPVIPSLSTVLALTILGVSGQAQVFGEGDPTPLTVGESASVTVNADHSPLKEVVDAIRARSNANIVLAPGTEGVVTLSFKNVPWREALDLVAENSGCIVTELKGRVYRIDKPPRVSFQFNEEDIRNVIQSIATQANANIIVAPDITGLVTMKIDDRPWSVVLDAVVKTLGFHVVEEDYGVLRIVSSEALVQQLETRVFELRYLRPQSPYVATIDTDFAVGGPKAPANDPDVDFPLLGALRKLLSSGGDLDYLDKQNAIFVKDTKPVLDKISEVIARLDVEPAEIFIDVKFVTTTDSSGVDLAFGVEQLTATWNGAAIPSKVPFNMGPGGFDDHVFPSSPDSGSMYGPLGGSFVDDLILKTGLLDFRNVRLAIRLNENFNNVDVVQAPKIITLDHQEATVFVGNIIRYAETSAATNQGGGLSFSVQEAPSSPVETGFQLLIIPHVIPGTSKVLMTVIPQAKFLSGTSDANQAGFNLFGSGEATISLPQVTSQTIVTNMMLESGQTGVIGGLVTDRKSKAVYKVPFLGDLPYIGVFFRTEQESEAHEHLLVFLTPTVIRGSSDSDMNLNEILAASGVRSLEEWRTLLNLPENGDATQLPPEEADSGSSADER